MWTLPYISFERILINLINFIGTPNSVKISYNTSLLTDVIGLLEVYKQLCIPHYTPTFMQYLTNAECLISS